MAGATAGGTPQGGVDNQSGDPKGVEEAIRSATPQESVPAGHGGGSQKKPPANGDEDGTPQKRLFLRLREAFNLPPDVLKNISSASMLVFFLASLCIMFVLVVYTPLSVPNVEVFRATQLLLTLAGTAVILGLLTKDLNAFTVVFGFLVIAALIVPTRDIIRFALIASGSGQQYRDIFPDFADAKNQTDRTSEIARQIHQAVATELIHSAEPTSEEPAFPLSAEDSGEGEASSGDSLDIRTLIDDRRANALASIESILRDARDMETFERIAQKGAVETLKAIGRGEKNEWIYRYSGNEDFRSNLDYLRFEGAISFDYGDLDLVAVTTHGCALLRKFVAVTAQDVAGAYVNCLRPITSSIDVLDVYRASLSIGTDGVTLPFQVDEAAMYEICALPANKDSVADPKLALLSRDETVLVASDDFESTLAARITYRLEPDTQYLLRVEDYLPISESGVDLLIEIQDSAAEPGEPCGGGLAELAGTLFELPAEEPIETEEPIEANPTAEPEEIPARETEDVAPAQ